MVEFKTLLDSARLSVSKALAEMPEEQAGVLIAFKEYLLSMNDFYLKLSDWNCENIGQIFLGLDRFSFELLLDRVPTNVAEPVGDLLRFFRRESPQFENLIVVLREERETFRAKIRLQDSLTTDPTGQDHDQPQQT